MNIKFRLSSKFNISAYTNPILEILYLDRFHLKIISDSQDQGKIEKFHRVGELQPNTVLVDRNRYFDKKN